MSEPPAKRRRTFANLYLDLEAAVDHDEEPEVYENEEDRAFIDDELEGGEDDTGRRQQFIDFLRKDGQLGDGGSPEEQDDANILREILGMELEDGEGAENPLAVDDETDEDEVASVPRPLWAEIGQVNAAVSGALSTWQDDDDERRVSAEDTLYEASCQPGMEETIAFRIFSWAMQVDSSGPIHNIFERVAGSNPPLPRHDVESSGRKPIPLARSAIANPYLRGRVYIESANIGYVQRLARRIRGLIPASVRPVPRELLLRPLAMMRHSFPDRSFVRLLDPPCPTMTCLIFGDYLLMVPNKLAQGDKMFNADTDAMPAPPPASHIAEPSIDLVYPNSNLGVDKYGFRYYPLKMLSPASLEAYDPSIPEIELLFKFRRLDSQCYQSYMSRVIAYGFSCGDRVIFQTGPFQSLTGTVLDPGQDGSCHVYIPSQGTAVQVVRQQLRRHFCVGDRVSATTEDVTEKLGSRFGWVVGVSDGYKNVGSSVETVYASAGQPGTQARYRVDLRVFSPDSGNEIIAAHYEFRFEDDSAVSLRTVPISSPVSEMKLGAMYTLTIPVGSFEYESFTGIIANIEGVHIRIPGSETVTELAATIIFSIWDKDNNARFGYPPNWIVPVPDFSHFNIAIGETVTLKDREGRSGTARITNLGRQEVSLANFTGALKFSGSASVHRVGPYDEHIGKTVCVSKGPFKGGIGLVKAVNAVGMCTVELSTQPIRRINVNISRLTAVDESDLYLSLVPVIQALLPRSVTPPAPASSSDDPPAFQICSSDLLADVAQPPEFDCSWLAQPFAQQLRIKLEPINHKMRRPYHFSAAFYDNTGTTPRLMIRVFDRKREREFAADKLRWVPANDINQTVVRITGENIGTLYWTIAVESDICHVRHVPSTRGAPLSSFPRLELAQVNAKRT